MSEQYSPTGFRVLPPVVKHLLIINVLLYLATFTMNRFQIDLTDYLGLHFFLENIWGSKRFLWFYMLCGIGAGLCQEVVQYIQYTTTLAQYDSVNFGGGQVISMANYLNMLNTVGASGAIYGLLLAFGMMFPNSMIYLYFFVPIKAKWFVIGYAVIELVSGFIGGGNVAHFAHLGGMLFGLILILVWKKKGRLYGDQIF